MSIHAATILRSFVRDINNYLERPDFNKLFVDYVVLGLHASLADNPSITNSLAYDYLK
jgi:ethanolamine ammonia-lyase small subunit